MLAALSIAIDLPLKILVAEDAEGKVWVSYNSAEYLKERHGLSDITGITAYQLSPTTGKTPFSPARVRSTKFHQAEIASGLSLALIENALSRTLQNWLRLEPRRFR